MQAAKSLIQETPTLEASFPPAWFGQLQSKLSTKDRSGPVQQKYFQKLSLQTNTNLPETPEIPSSQETKELCESLSNLKVIKSKDSSEETQEEKTTDEKEEEEEYYKESFDVDPSVDDASVVPGFDSFNQSCQWEQAELNPMYPQTQEQLKEFFYSIINILKYRQTNYFYLYYLLSTCRQMVYDPDLEDVYDEVDKKFQQHGVDTHMSNDDLHYYTHQYFMTMGIPVAAVSYGG